MGNTTENSTETDINDHKLNKKKYMILATIGFVAIFIVFLVYWLLVLRNQQNTDDAYVAGMQIPIIAQTNGNVTEILFDNTDLVHAGDIIVVLDNTKTKLAFENAKHDLANAVRQVQQLYQDNIAYKASIEQNKILLAQSERDYLRRVQLEKTTSISKEDFQHSKEQFELAKVSLELAVQKLKSNEAMLLNTTPDQQPSILIASNQVKEAWINLQRTYIRSPITGYVARRSVQVGSEVSSATPLMVVVPTDPMWIDANFKETQLDSIRIGQPVKMTSDLYGSNVVYTGTVTGVNMGTGSVFSLLPAQNATGNWIKIVQRLPVRIDLDPQQLQANPLRIGLSMNVTIDTSDKTGATIKLDKRTDSVYKSDVLVLNLDEIELIIEQIINNNTFSKLEINE